MPLVNLSDLHHHVVEPIRDHPGVLAAFLVGAAVSFAVGFWLAWRSARSAGREEVARLHSEADALRREDYRGRKKVVELALVRQQVKAVAQRAYKFRSYGKALQRRLRAETSARAKEAERHREVTEQLTAELDAARAEVDALAAQLGRVGAIVDGQSGGESVSPVPS